MAHPLKEMPTISENGAFGARRRHDIHTGIDLYAPEGTDVFAIRSGWVSKVAPFTGPGAESPWWLPTDYVGISDEDQRSQSYIVYGEIEPLVTRNQYVKEGQLIGKVKRVLRNDKGLPTSMLHLEHYVEYVPDPFVWKDGEKPRDLLDPTPLVQDVRFNHNATTCQGARDYLRNRAQQLLHTGFTLWSITTHDEAEEAVFLSAASSELYSSFYVYPRFRGRGVLKKLAKKTERPIITTDDCGIKDYLQEYRIPHIVVNGVTQSSEYRMISRFYGDRKAKRSGQFYMKHIDEGLAHLTRLGADEITQRAWCLHPIVQNDEDLTKNWLSFLSYDVDPRTLILAMEYRSVANEYLAHREIGTFNEIRLSPLKAVNQMLWADKIQNQDDLVRYNRNHPRYDELYAYFVNWFERLKGNV